MYQDSIRLHSNVVKILHTCICVSFISHPKLYYDFFSKYAIRNTLYAYQMFGQVNWDQETRNKVLQETHEEFKSWDGLISRTVLWDDVSEIATVIYLCETQEAAIKAREHVRREREKYDKLVDYSTELVARVVGHDVFK